MADQKSGLTEGDIQVLVRGPTEDERAVAAHKLCRRIDSGLNDEDRQAAHEVIRLMATDAAELVRRALAVTLKNSPALPREVALALARDVDSVATPVLTFSPVFTDEDLAEIVRISTGLKQLAVARRPVLSETVTSAIALHGGEPAVRVACANDSATFSRQSLDIAVERFARSDGVAVAIAYRKALPPSISEKLVTLVSDQMRQRLVDRHRLSAETALNIAMGSRERATVDLVEQAGRASDLRAFTAHLHRQERLTASLLLRALVNGHMRFFEWGMAELSGVAHHRTWVMIHDAGPLGLRAVYDRAGLPEGLYRAFRVAVDTFHALHLEGGELEVEDFQQRMLERFLTGVEDHAPQDIDYLLDRMDRLADLRYGAAEPHRLHTAA